MANRALAVIFGVDALISMGFGVASWLAPHATYGTIVNLQGSGDAGVLLAALGSLSLFYVFVGAVCATAVWMQPPHNVRIAAVMVVRHAWIGVKGFQEANSAWIVGNPWVDIAIHSAFVLAYTVCVWWALCDHGAEPRG
jgi:hypothetical protein